MKKKIFTFLLALVVGIGSMWAQNPSGTCGEDLTWEFNPSTGALTISGTGTTMTSIGWVSGVWNDQVTSVTFPESLTSIEVMSAFQGFRMSTITLPENLTELGMAAFYQCSALTSIKIPAGMSTIQGVTFSQCSSLATVILPASITTIYDFAFADCPALTSFYSYAETPPTCESNKVFWDQMEWKPLDLSAATLYVPYSSIADYKAANGWNSFGTIAAIPGTEPAPAGNLKLVEFQVPASWENDNSPITSADFPDFVATTYEIASALPVTSEPSLVVFDFPEVDEMSVYSKMGGQVSGPSTGTIVRESFFENTQVHYYYPVLDDPEPEPQPAGDGKLTGAFTINADGDQILFSKGNLQYQASTSTLRFATNQYDMIGEDNANISDTYTGWIDLFGWGTGNCPTKKSEKDEDYSTFTDWGVNAISNGGNEANLWRTLTIQEWGYLIKTRTNADNLKGQATVADVHGYVLLPDSWTLPAGLSFAASPNNWTTNVYTAEQWAQMEAAGAVFLPATGYRDPEIKGVNEKGWYWSSDVLSADAAYDFEFNETTSRVFGSRHYFGQPVRLVTAYDAPTPTPANPSGSCGENLTWEFNTETGALTISGTGEMTSAPWGTYKEDITSLSLPDGLTAIPSEAFKGCTGLTTVTIPASVTSIGADAFLGCESVTDVYCYPKAADLNWDDYYKDDFIEEHLVTRCHVYADEFDGYMDKYADADGVNVTFMNDLEAVAVTTNEDPQNAGTVYYSTYYNSAKKYILPAGCEAYTAMLSGDALTLTKIAVGGQTIPNGAAVILKSGSASVTLLPTETDPVSYNAATNSLLGVDEVTTAPANCYVLSCENNLVGFYHYTADKLNAHKAYIIYSGSNQAPRRLRFVFDQATDVESIQPSAVSSQKVFRDGQLVIIRNGVEYNAAGQMVK